MTKKFDLDSLDDFTRGYIGAILFSTTDNSDESGGKPLDVNYSEYDISSSAMAQIKRDCKAFQKENRSLLSQAYLEDGRYDEHKAGFDFWLTREGHGAGFWDRGFGAVGDALTKNSKTYGSFDLYVNKGKVFASGYESKSRKKSLREIVRKMK
jgi:hypothetical protein